MNKYCSKLNVPRKTLLYYMRIIPELETMRKLGNGTLENAENIYDLFVMRRKKKMSIQLRKAHEGNRYMSEDEEEILGTIAMLLAASGRGICEDELLELMNLIILENRDKRMFVPATMKTLRGLIKRNDKLKQSVRYGGSLDPARAAKANNETRKSMFTKLNNYVVLMHELGKCEEKSYSEFKSNAIYNMDECALDTSKTRRKIICSKEGVKRLFQITPEGDGKMHVHISIALTSRADGEL